MVNPSTQSITPEKYLPYVAHWQQHKVDMRSRLQKRHQAGLMQAEAFAHILKSDFGATKVVLFGSMRSVNDIHIESDIDLAVWNLPYEEYGAALGRLLSSREFDVDLVRIEEASPSLKTHIVTEGLTLGVDNLQHSSPQSPLPQNHAFMPSHAALIGRIQRELNDINAQYRQTQDQLNVARETGQSAYWMAVSLGLHGIYTGLEKIFEQIAREVDGSLNKHDRWHKALLEQMASEIPRIRAAVIDAQTFQSLEKYLAFRHVVRSNYAYRLEPERIDANFQILENCYNPLVAQLNAFCNFLSSVD